MRFQGYATAFVVLTVLASLTSADDKEKPKPKTQEVKIRDITLTVPASWKKVKPSNRLRAGQFELPISKKDSEAGFKEKVELVVSTFPGGGGGVDPNVRRWKAEFRDLKIKLTRGKCKQGEYVLADLTGIHVGSSFRRRPKPLENARMLGVVLAVPKKGIYFLKVTGPKETMKEAEKAFRASFGGNAKEEKEYKPAG